MGKCPFWSTKKEAFNCYSGCPMQSMAETNELCPFKELSINEKITYKDLIQSDFAYNKENLLGYEFEPRIKMY